MISATSPFNMSKLHKLKRRINSILSRFREVLNNKNIKENTQTYIDNIDLQTNQLLNNLPSDTTFANTFAKEVFQPYDTNPYMMRLGYHIVIKYLPVSTSVDMINQFIYNTCAIARDEKTTKHKILVEADNIKKSDDKKDTTKNINDDLSLNRTILDYTIYIINCMKKAVRLDQPSDEDAACYIFNMFVNQINTLKKFTNRVPDDAIPKILNSCKYAVKLVNIKETDSTATKKIPSSDINVHHVKKQIKDLHKGIRKGIPPPKNLAKLIKIIRATLSALSTCLQNDKIKENVNIFIHHLSSDVELDKCIQALKNQTNICSKNLQMNNNNTKILADIFSIISGLN